MNTINEQLVAEKKNSRWAIRPLVSEEVYTNREEHLEYLYNAALEAIGRRTMSTVLLGQRRMGKTEIFKRVVNTLFFGQDNYEKGNSSVVPVYYSFRDTVIDRWMFATEYVENFLRWYTAFRLHDPFILSAHNVKYQDLAEIIRTRLEITPGIQGALNIFEELHDKTVIIPEKDALWLPRRVSDVDETTIVMFLDEFQNTRLPQYEFDIVGYMQEAVESPTCPHFVTGSAMSILAREILGRGSLFGRFDSHPIEPMTNYWGAQLALKAALYHKTDMLDEMAPVVSDRCGGNPFYITAVVRQAAKQGKPIVSEETLNEILAVDLSSGFIWAELNDQVIKWIERINQYGITKWVLYLSALEEGDRLDLDRIQKELAEREGKHVPMDTIRDVLIKLSRGDLLQYMELGGWFKKIDDPILLEFLKVWGRIEVEGQDRAAVQNDLRTQYQTIKRRIHDHRGYLAEVYIAQILWTGQNKTLPGKFFHSKEDITLPWHFSYVKLRSRLGGGSGMEIDVEGGAGKERWICESKWWVDRKVGRAEVESLMRKGNIVKEEVGEGLQILRLWFFAHDGFTEDAKALMLKNGVLWSTRDDLDGLLESVGLRRLPNIVNKKGIEGNGRKKL
ncbi:MAG: hypothetical protein JRG74_07760 [Deltaproteobacteria bacterium]|nr:hypothetical protein [Deltaproteobacteria bacterium]MBW2165979.1 hypothetical protein [Deltaproteobacteria bacterium]